jgi:hypothetical protein
MTGNPGGWSASINAALRISALSNAAAQAQPAAEAEAIGLGARFGQEAIFVLTPADHRVAGCAERRIAATGWSIEPEGNACA